MAAKAAEHAELRHQEAELKELSIRRMHEYNDIKDFAQFLLGKLALLKQTTVARLYPDFGLLPED